MPNTVTANAPVNGAAAAVLRANAAQAPDSAVKMSVSLETVPSRIQETVVVICRGRRATQLMEPAAGPRLTLARSFTETAATRVGNADRFPKTAARDVSRSLGSVARDASRDTYHDAKTNASISHLAVFFF